MGWGAQTWGTFTKETTYGVFAGAGATCFPILHQNNAFTPRKVPQRQIIRSADAGNRRRNVVANRYGVRGTLNTILFPSQGPYWATMLTPSGTPPVLPSYSFTFWDSVRAWKLLGGMVEKFTLSSTSDQDYVTLSLDLIFQTVDQTFTIFTQPAQSSYPTENPYGHVETSGKVLLAAAAITKYKSLTVSVGNMLAAPWDEQASISNCTYCGRDIDFSFIPQFVTKNYRDTFENQTPGTWILQWARSTQNFTLTLQDSTFFGSVADDLPLNGIGYQTIGGETFFSLPATTDATITSV